MSKAGSDFQSTIRDVARRYSEIWQTGNVDIADDICHPSFQSYDLLKGGELVSKDAFKNMIKEVFKFWHPETSDIDIATTPGDNKAFVHWTATGKLQDRAEKVTTFGLNLLEVDPEGGKILRSAGFRQLEPNEVEAMLKEDAFKKLEQ
jgi:SnoaL-like polyketide cyclase